MNKIKYEGNMLELFNDLKSVGYRVKLEKDGSLIINDKIFNLKQYIKSRGLKISDIIKETGISRNTILSILSMSDSCFVRKFVRVIEFIGLKLEFEPMSVADTYKKNLDTKDLTSWSLKCGLAEGTISRIILDYTNCKLGTLRKLMECMELDFKINVRSNK